MQYKFRKNDGKWKRLASFDDLAGVLFGITRLDTIEIKIECEHNNTWVDQGIRICKDCGEQLEVTSFRD